MIAQSEIEHRIFLCFILAFIRQNIDKNMNFMYNKKIGV